MGNPEDHASGRLFLKRMGWLDQLEEHGRKTVKEARKRGLRPKTQEAIVTVRQSSDNDPGEVAIGYYIVDDESRLTLTDENGMSLEGAEPVLLEDRAAARSVAVNLTLKRWQATRDGFNRQLGYPQLGIAQARQYNGFNRPLRYSRRGAA